MTKTKTLIQRGDMLYCDKCHQAWTIGQDELHLTTCEWYEHHPRHKRDKARADEAQKRYEATETFRRENARDIARRDTRLMGEVHSGMERGGFLRLQAYPVPIYGWVCSRCQRVYGPQVDECPHCQPPNACQGTIGRVP